jgi:hypothetical protein
VTAGTPEGLNNLPAEAKVNPVFIGTGIFLLWTSSPRVRRGQREGDYVERKEGANSNQSIR